MLNGAIQLLVISCGLGGVQITPAYDVTVWSIEVESASDVVKIAKW